MSEEKQYILRKPIEIERKTVPTSWQNSGDLKVVSAIIANTQCSFVANQFDDQFVEFDEELLHQQLMQDKELFHLASLIGCEPEHEERRREKLADYVLGLIKGKQS